MQTETGDAALWVEFFKRPVHMTFKSEKEGRPIYEDRDFIRITTPGDRTSIIEREARNEDKERFRHKYEKYLSGQDVSTEGTPLEHWPQLTRSQVEELKHLKCFTVEQLAATSDAQCSRLGPGFLGLRTKASAFLEAAKDTAVAQKYAAENEALRQEMADLKAQFAQLAEARKRKDAA